MGVWGSPLYIVVEMMLINCLKEQIIQYILLWTRHLIYDIVVIKITIHVDHIMSVVEV